MKYFRLVILFASIFWLTLFSCKQKNPDNYTLEIKSIKSAKINGNTDILLSTILTNNTNTTLRYFCLSCAWDIIYKTDNDNVEIIGPEACDANYPITLVLEPYQNVERDFHISINNKLNNSNEKFRIAINIIETKNYQGLTQIADSIHLNKTGHRPGFVVWSNAIEYR